MTRNQGSHVRAREGIRRTRVKNVGVKNARIIIRIATWNIDQIAGTRDTIPIPADGKLHTTGIKLCTTKGSSEMESDDFMADEIVSRSDVLRNLDGRDATLEEVVLDPV